MLAVDTAGEALSAALRAGGRTWSVHRVYSRPHDETLLPAVDRLLSRARAKPEALRAIVAASGPGRFTGIRIGMAFAATAAGQLRVPAVAVSRFEAVAFKTPGARVCAAVAGWKEERFYQLFVRRGEGPPRSRAEPVWVAPQDWARRRDELAAAGWIVSELETTAADLLAPAAERLKRRSVGRFEPLYLKPASYERGHKASPRG